MPNALARPGPQLVFAVAGALVFVGSLFYFVARYAWGMDGVPTGGAAPAVFLNVALFSVFALHHSIFARSGAKAMVMRRFPAPLERSVYVWIASLLFILVCALWQPVAGLVWEVQGSGRAVMQLGQLGVAIFILMAARRLDVLELSGVLQVLDPGRDAPKPSLDVHGPYGLVRHPIYLGWILFVALAPTMNGTRLVFALVSSAYLFLAVPFEERDLRRTFGTAYDEYAKRVRWKILPLIY
ncbi:MAG TPA: isoprenylcysteine carboxylmethyltransferase family protein [Vicinamibacterales bacterium]|nr:isoprenylcysteine carboxylmethyltransferase family protein [Vicinamibacterales bacterium]